MGRGVALNVLNAPGRRSDLFLESLGRGHGHQPSSRHKAAAGVNRLFEPMTDSRHEKVAVWAGRAIVAWRH